MLDRLQPVTDLGLDLRKVPHLLGVPRFMYGSLVRDLGSMLMERLRGHAAAAFRHEMMVMFFGGYFLARWNERRAGETPARHPEPSDPQRTSNVVITGR
jgi:hypothetical protein